MQINRTSVPVGRNIANTDFANIIDQRNKLERFIPIAVIQHRGSVTGGDTSGHYTADIYKNFQWYHYSDDSKPKPISKPTDQGYIFLLKKI